MEFSHCYNAYFHWCAAARQWKVQGFCLIPAFFLAPIIPRMGFYGLKHKAFSIIQDTLATCCQ